jgi:hypothetical protein
LGGMPSGLPGKTGRGTDKKAALLEERKYRRV